MYGANYYGRKPYAVGEVFYPTESLLYSEGLALSEIKTRTVLRENDETSLLNEDSPTKFVSWFITEGVYLVESIGKYIEKILSEVTNVVENVLRKVLRTNTESVQYTDLGILRKVLRTVLDRIRGRETTKREIMKNLEEGALMSETLKAAIPGGKYIWNKIGAVVSNIWTKQDREIDSSSTKIDRPGTNVWIKIDRPTEINLPFKIGRVLSADWAKVLRAIDGVTTKISRVLSNLWTGIAKPSVEGYTKIQKEVTNVWSKTGRASETLTTKQSRSLTNLWTKKDRPNE